jgi:hypothetical protein
MHWLPGVATILDCLARIERKLDILISQGVQTMADLSALTAQVTANTTVEQSAITLINGLAAQITAAGTDPTKLASLVSQLNTSATALSAAVAANTVAGPSPTPAQVTGAQQKSK